MYRLLFIVFLLFNFLYAQKNDKITFAPLPIKSAGKITKDFLPLINYLESKLSKKIEFKHFKNYNEILEGIQNGSIDMAYLGPLPFLSLKEKYDSVEPIVSFKEKNGKHKYRCVLAKFRGDKIDFSKNLRIALTQPLSTCGYYMSKKLLKTSFNKDISKEKFDYRMSHENAIKSVLQGKFHIAGAKDSITKSYNSLGIDIIAHSPLLPGFTLVVNRKKIDYELKNSIQDILLNIPKNTYEQWKGKGSYGLVKVSMKDYKNLDLSNSFIPLKGNINEE